MNRLGSYAGLGLLGPDAGIVGMDAVLWEVGWGYVYPDVDGDRLFIIIPKQAAWLGGMVDLVEKENEGLTLNAAQIAALEKEFMETFETFTVILSLIKK